VGERDRGPAVGRIPVSNGTPLDVELMAADVNGDMAYTIGYERCSGSVHGGPARPVFLATQIYRRENGE